MVPRAPRTPSSDDIDAWPTQTLEDHELTAMADEMTRIGTPAYTESAQTASSASEGPVRSQPSQAMRVIVWRAADGVHIAPHGTSVAAITIDALLVAIDPGTDLATWLADK
jgi:hypothetical protein